MTVLDTTPAANDATGERRAAARDAYRTSLAEGVPLTGAELGRRFGLSPRWGRLRVAEVHAEAAAAGNGRHPGRHVAHKAREHDPARSQPENDGGDASIRRRAEPASDRTNGSRRHPDRPSASERDRSRMHRRRSRHWSTASRRSPCWRWRSSPRSRRTTTSGLWPSWPTRAGARGFCRSRLMGSSLPRPCRCWCGAVPACPLGRSLGHRCSPVSVRAWLPMSLPPTPRWSAGSWPPGHRSLYCSPGSCCCRSEHLRRRAASHDDLPAAAPSSVDGASGWPRRGAWRRCWWRVGRARPGLGHSAFWCGGRHGWRLLAHRAVELRRRARW